MGVHTSPTAKSFPSRLIETQVAALILSLVLPPTLDVFGESVLSGVEGLNGGPASPKDPRARVRPSPPALPVEAIGVLLELGVADPAAGLARKKCWEKLES